MLIPAGNKDLNKNIKYLIALVIIINLIGLSLRYLGLDTYFILLGFRFQLSLCLPFFIFPGKESKGLLLNIFKNPSYKKSYLFIYLLIIPLLIIFAVLFLLKKIEPGDPDYFYEFGLSSIIDYPVYLVWNSIQLIFFFLFLIYITSKLKFKYLLTVFIFILLFSYEVVPLKKESFDFFQVISLILSAATAGLLIKYFQNIYWLIIFSFSVFWVNILLFGSNSEMIINLLFASQYNSWEGFFSVSKIFKSFLLPAQLLLINILIVVNLLINKAKL